MLFQTPYSQLTWRVLCITGCVSMGSETTAHFPYPDLPIHHTIFGALVAENFTVGSKLLLSLVFLTQMSDCHRIWSECRPNTRLITCLSDFRNFL